MTDHNEQDARQKVWDMIRNIDIALMVTHDSQGRMHARPMGTQQRDKDAPFDGTLWFMTYENSPKLDEIKADNRVLISYSDTKSQNYVSVTGTATAFKDTAKVNELWTPSLEVWFPDGPNDPKIVLIKVDAETAEYWDTPSKSLIHAFGFVKAKLTGEAPNPGDHKKIAV